MNYEIVNLNEMLVEGLMVKTTNENGKSGIDIGNLWNTFFTTHTYEKIEYLKNNKTVGLYTDYEGDYTKPYNFLVCAEVEKESTNLENRVVKKIPQGKYAKFVITGDIKDAVMDFWSNLWKMDLRRNYTFDFEEYQMNEASNTTQEIHIYISIY